MKKIINRILPEVKYAAKNMQSKLLEVLQTVKKQIH